MLDAVLELIPGARVGHIGLQRDESTAIASQYYSKLPKKLEQSVVLMIDPMLATGGSAVAALDQLTQAGARDIRMICIVAAPEGVDLVQKHHPGVAHLHAGHRSPAERPQVHRPRPRRLRRSPLRHRMTSKPRPVGLRTRKDDHQKWHTALTCIEPNKILVRGYPLDEMMGRLTFGEAIYLLLMGEVPTPAIGSLMEAILVSFIDHGVTPPSTLAARNTATTGAPLRACVAAGVLGFGRHHGGDIESCMQFLDAGLELVRKGSSYRDAAGGDRRSAAWTRASRCPASATASTPAIRARRGCSRWRWSWRSRASTSR